MDELETFLQFIVKNTAAGQYPHIMWQLRGLHRYRDAHGIAEAFVQIGSRWLVKRLKLYELLGKSVSQRPVAAPVPPKRKAVTPVGRPRKIPAPLPRRARTAA